MCMHFFNTCYDPAESTCILLVDRSMTSPSIEIRELYSNFGVSIRSYIIESAYVSANWHFLGIDFIHYCRNGIPERRHHLLDLLSMYNTSLLLAVCYRCHSRNDNPVMTP